MITKKKLKKIVFINMLIVCVMGLNNPVCAQPSSEDLRQIEAQLQKEKKNQIEARKLASKLADEIRAVQRKMVQSANEVQEKEALLDQLEKRLDELQNQEAELLVRLQASKAQTVQLVTALQSLALRPKEQLFLEKQAPKNILRSRLVLNSTVPIVKEISTQVLLDMDKLEKTKIEMQDQMQNLKETMSKLESKTQMMNQLIKKKSKLQTQYDKTHQRSTKKIAELANKAKDIKELLNQLEKERQEQERLEQERRLKQEEQERSRLLPFTHPTGNFARVKGMLQHPVIGQIVENYGDATGSGMHAKGMTIQSKQGATVRVPYDGVVLFSGPFKSYGNMLIIDNGDGYLMLLAGLESISATTGQEVISGEPVGYMGRDRTKIYLEIRKNGQAINPAPWFVRR